MASENLVKGLSYRIKSAVEGVWDKCSFKTHASDVFFDDDNSDDNAYNNLADIKGITDELTCEDENVALSAVAGKQLNDSLGGLIFAQDSEGNWGYLPSGADSVIPFKKGGSTEIIELGSGTSFDVSSYDGYENFTVDNFIVEMANLSGWNNKTNSTINSSGTYYFSNVSISLTKTYNAETGKLTASYKATNKYGTHMASTPNATANKTINVKAYLILK